MTTLQKPNPWWSLAACLLLTLLAAPAATGAPITFALTGRITAVIDEHQLLDGTLQAGGTVDARYTVDHDDAGGTTVVFGDGQSGRRVPAGGGVVGGSYRAGNGDAGNVTLLEPCIFTIDCSHLATYALVLPLLTVDGLEQEFRMDLGGLAGSLFAPVPFWERLDDFETHAYSWRFSTANGTALVVGVVTSLEPVPEPSTIALLVLGLLPAARLGSRSAARHVPYAARHENSVLMTPPAPS